MSVQKPKIQYRKKPEPSKTIRKWCEKNNDIVDEYLCDTDGHWIYLKEGWVHKEMECGTVREDTVKEAMERLTRNQIEYWGN